MTLEALASNELPTFLVYDTISATPLHHPTDASSCSSLLFDNAGGCDGLSSLGVGHSMPVMLGSLADSSPRTTAGQGRRKRRRRPRSCENKEEAESQRMTHIAVERNRRRQMNEHLAVLRSLMPESYVQRGCRSFGVGFLTMLYTSIHLGDQASVVGGAIDFVKELEQLLQSLEVQKRTLQQKKSKAEKTPSIEPRSTSSSTDEYGSPPFSQFFAYPQYIWRHAPRDRPPPENRSAVADIEVTLTETHANLRILSPRRPRQILKMVAGLQSLRLTILHLNVTTLDSMVLYSLSAKVEEGCNLTTVDDIAAAVHHMLSLVEAESAEMTALSQ